MNPYQPPRAHPTPAPGPVDDLAAAKVLGGRYVRVGVVVAVVAALAGLGVLHVGLPNSTVAPFGPKGPSAEALTLLGVVFLLCCGATLSAGGAVLWLVSGVGLRRRPKA